MSKTNQQYLFYRLIPFFFAHAPTGCVDSGGIVPGSAAGPDQPGSACPPQHAFLISSLLLGIAHQQNPARGVDEILFIGAQRIVAGVEIEDRD